MTAHRWPFAALLALLALLGLSACGNDRPDDRYYAAAVCVDQNGVRVPDDYCPIGDGIDNQGFAWTYHPYDVHTHDVDVVYVGYPVDRSWTRTRPVRVTTINIDRGRYPERPLAGTPAGATTARVITVAEDRREKASGSSTVTRGGLGTPGARNAEAPAPARNLDSPAPGRKPTATATPAPLPPAPATRAVAKTTKTTTKKAK